MSISFSNALGIHESAFKVRAQRASVLADNLANVDTPNYKARDLDFKAAMAAQSNPSSRFSLNTTQSGHLPARGFLDNDPSKAYRVPTQPSIDGNTVEEHVEHAEFMKNALEFQASFQFLNSRFKGLLSALRGE
ncbi:flagellar basal body rod protein FlgB [Marinimicrobium alkaliphilum]|uniref:flagellar basal body rod protein FlgB n=1 Tax=Marinimicrobium alkaliphilum TaxID=2202654 RepID=UPI000DBA4435|nr:flagellar basal body rod protein FlgB [Marinimicrobium alkaliphilum]